MIKKRKNNLKNFVLYPPKNGGILKSEVICIILAISTLFFINSYWEAKYIPGFENALIYDHFRFVALFFGTAAILTYLINIQRYDQAYRYRENLVSLFLLIIIVVLFITTGVFEKHTGRY